jgi:nicotinamide-nucleotide amidase
MGGDLTSGTMDVTVITVGDEILSGRTLDTNFHFLAGSLTRLGIGVSRHLTVGDRPSEIRDAIRLAVGSARLVLVSGGLGGTPDDVTIDGAADALGRGVRDAVDLRQELEATYAARGQRIPSTIGRLAREIDGARRLHNPVGQAPGQLIAAAGATVVLLPGVPAELRGIFERSLAPLLAVERGGRTTHVFRTAGIGEGQLSERIGALGISGVSFLPSAGRVDLCLRLPDAPGDDATARIQAVRDAVGDALYAESDETLEEVVGRELARRRERLAVAESLTGGSLGAAIVGVPGASAYFLGSAAAYANALKTLWLGVPEEHFAGPGAVSAEVAYAMADGVRARTGAEWGISTTGIAGPTGGTAEKPTGLVYFGLARPEGRVEVVRRRFTGGRSVVIERTVAAALDLLRRGLFDLPVREEG